MKRTVKYNSMTKREVLLMEHSVKRKSMTKHEKFIM